ncbi:MAG: YicC family protein [Deltaproteobacteria bacterium]|nr:YicC family protein [Deltaproteobacteria bacterium]
MPRSMTGYGRADFAAGQGAYSIEIKALNNRFLDLNLRLPERFAGLDAMVRDEVKRRFSRGSFSIYLNTVSTETPGLRLNLAMARLYVEAGEALKRELGVSGEVDVPLLLKQNDIFTCEKKTADAEADWEPVKKALLAAFDQVDDWRSKEGAALAADLLSRLVALEAHAASVAGRAPGVIASYRAKLRDEMDKLIAGKADEGRILLEAGIFAQRSDISEELTRLASHATLFRQYLAANEPAGKRLDFLCQEMGREINTIGSKSSDASITKSVVEMKGEMEKIREQVQNIE